MQVNSDGSVSMMDGVTLDKNSFLKLVGAILQQLGKEEEHTPPKPIEVAAIEEVTVIRQHYKDGDYTYPQLVAAMEAFKVKYNERLHFLMDWVVML